ncbi:MAG: molybdopterin cofactor-binding domain-containing protein, partial [Polyangiales bacterium]
GDGKVMHAQTKREASYGDLTKLAAHQPVPAKPKLKAVKDFTLIGKTNNRVDARAKVNGTAAYGIDVSVPGMVNATMIHGPVYGARPDTVDDVAARKHPGVIDIFATQYGVAVVADKYWQAIAAARDVKVTWKDGATKGLDTEKLAKAMRAYDDEDGTMTFEKGNAGKALGNAATKLSAIYEAPYLAHAPMEPQNATVSVKGGKAEVWAPTQSPTITQAFVAAAIGGDMDDVLVHTTLSGGGFGRRALADVVAEAAVCSKHVKRPVKLVWSRESDMTQGFYRPIYAIKMDGGLAADGHATALRAHAISQSIALSSKELMGAALPGIPNAMKGMVVDSLLAMFSTNSVGDLFATEGLKDTPYQIGNVLISATPVQTKLPVASWRSVGNSVTGFAAESFIDEMAHAAKADPLAFRRKHVKDGSRQARVLDALAALAKWGTAPAKGIGRGVARHYSFETEVGEVADVEIVDGRIKVRRVYCVVDCGIAVNPDVVRAQMGGGIIFGLSAALDQEITIIDGVVQQRNYDSFPALRMFEAPEIVVQILESDRDPTGVGEPGLPPIAAAVANAIFSLTGTRLRRLPLQRGLDEAKGDTRPTTVAGGAQ